MRDLKKRIANLTGLIEKSLPFVRKEVDRIIKNNIVSEPRIENVLDTLLNFNSMGYGKDEFKKLNNYYKTINEKSSESYESLLRKL